MDSWRRPKPVKFSPCGVVFGSPSHVYTGTLSLTACPHRLHFTRPEGLKLWRHSLTGPLRWTVRRVAAVPALATTHCGKRVIWRSGDNASELWRNVQARPATGADGRWTSTRKRFPTALLPTSNSSFLPATRSSAAYCRRDGLGTAGDVATANGIIDGYQDDVVALGPLVRAVINDHRQCGGSPAPPREPHRGQS